MFRYSLIDTRLMINANESLPQQQQQQHVQTRISRQSESYKDKPVFGIDRYVMRRCAVPGWGGDFPRLLPSKIVQAMMKGICSLRKDVLCCAPFAERL